MLATFKKYQHLLWTALYLMFWGGLLYWIDAAKLSIPVEFWDNVSTAGWALVPVAMVWAIAAFALNLREYRSKTAADTLAVLEQVENMQLLNDRVRRGS